MDLFLKSFWLSREVWPTYCFLPQPSASDQGLSSSRTIGKEGKESAQPLDKDFLILNTEKLSEKGPFSLRTSET